MWLWRKNRQADKTGPATTTTTAHPFSADRAIRSATEDRLNRKGFAYAIADAIANWRQRDSLVVGVYGRWGVGKTSIINMVRERLGEAAPPPVVVDFSPWEWAGHQELAEAFFDEVAKALPVKGQNSSADVATKFRRYALALHAGAALAESVAPVVAAVSVLVVVSGLGISEVDDSVARWGGRGLAALGAIGVILSQSKIVMSRLAELLADFGNRSRPSLSEAKRDLELALKKLDAPIVVVVDDIDRLTPSDTVRMLQIIKANADLPGVVVLLALDRESVAKSIRAALRVDGNGYLDKVIQVGFDVPTPDINVLQRMLFEGLDKAIEPGAVARRFDQARWQELYGRGIAPFFQTPRSIIRFVSALQLTLNRQIDDGECNVDPVDFIGAEVLRFFEPAVYGAIVHSKDALTGSSTGDTKAQHDVAERLRAVFTAAATTGPMQPASTHLIRSLFPAAEWAATGVGQIVDYQRLLAGRRVASREAFDRYFQFSIPTGDISEGEVSRIAALAKDGEAAVAESLRSTLEAGQMHAFLVRLTADPTRIPQGAEGEFIGALFDVGDSLEAQVERTRTWQFGAGETLQAEFLVEDLLERLAPDRRLEVLGRAVGATTGVHLPLNLVEYLMPRERHPETPGLPSGQLEHLARTLVSRVEALAATETLANHRHLASLVYSWERWGASGAAAHWCERLASSPGGLATLLRAFTGYGRADGGHALKGLIDLDKAASHASQWATDPAVEDGHKNALVSFLDSRRLGMWDISPAEEEQAFDSSAAEGESSSGDRLQESEDGQD